MPPERASPSSSDENLTLSGEQPSPSPSPSRSLDSALGSSSSSPSSAPDASGPEPEVTKKPKTPRPPARTWPAADEIALLEAVAAHREASGGRMPSPGDLAAGLCGRLRAEGPLDAERVAKRLNTLRCRYNSAAARLARGVIPAKNDDLRIYKLSKLIWEGARKPKKARGAEARRDPRELAELAGLYPCLAAEVEAIEAGCAAAAGGMLKRAFRRIGDDTAARLEEKAKRQRLSEARASARLYGLKRDVASMLLELIK
ncbi:hypothetical protein ACP4OV_006687 [Aristida adscensionis]